MMERLDLYDIKPSGMEAYLKNYGWHFSKKMYDWAVSMMKDRNNNSVKNLTKEEFETASGKYGFKLSYQGYDAPYVYAMAKADFMGSSLVDEIHCLKYVKDYIEDPDGYDTVAFTRFYADTIGKGVPIMWEDVI